MLCVVQRLLELPLLLIEQGQILHRAEVGRCDGQGFQVGSDGVIQPAQLGQGVGAAAEGADLAGAEGKRLVVGCQRVFPFFLLRFELRQAQVSINVATVELERALETLARLFVGAHLHVDGAPFVLQVGGVWAE